MKRFIATCAALTFLFAFICPFFSVQPEEPETYVVPNYYMEDFPIQPEEPDKAEETPEPYQPVVTELGTTKDGEYLWNSLSEHSPNDVITAGVLGYFYRESRLRSDAVAAWPQHNIGMEEDICTAFAAEVDAGMEDGSSRDYFIHEVSERYGGYGLGQWSAVEYLEQLYDFVRERGGSIADADLQCEFTVESMKRNERLWGMLTECDSPHLAGRMIGSLYDGTVAETANVIGDMASLFYKQHATGGMK